MKIEADDMNLFPYDKILRVKKLLCSVTLMYCD